MKVEGIRNVSFTADDGKLIEGKTVFCSYPITKNGSGLAFEKIFLSNNKLARLDFDLVIGSEIGVNYNRFGKIDTIFELMIE